MNLRLFFILGILLFGIMWIGQIGACSCGLALYRNEQTHESLGNGSKVTENELKKEPGLEEYPSVKDTVDSENTIDSTNTLQIHCESLPKIKNAMQGHIGTLAFHPNETWLASGTATDQGYKIWDLSTRKPLIHFTDTLCCTHQIQFDPSGKYITSATLFLSFWLFDVSTGKLLREYPPTGIRSPHENSIFTIAFSSDGKQIATGSSDTKIIIWDAQTSQVLKTLSGHSSIVESVAFHPKKPWLASASTDSSVKIWDTVSGGVILTLLEAQGWRILSVSFSSDGQLFAAGQAGGPIHLWKTSTWQKVGTLQGHSMAIPHLLFHPQGHILISSGDADKTVRFWDVKGGRQLLALSGAISTFRGLAFAPKSGIVAAGDLYDIWLWKCTF